MTGQLAMAQDGAAQQQAQTQAQTTQGQAGGVTKQGDVTTVTIVATRRSQQSSIERKKNAGTAMDSIVAEDVGSLPDRNVGEAISRIAGVALDRGDFNEGISVSIRGNGSDLTRVELDGQAVQNAGGSNLNGNDDGRSTEFRQLSADLIKSVDVVKGSTADMTEGSLGGGIRIETRNGLDFKEPFISVRAAKTQSSLSKNWTPDLNLIATKKFMHDRLGVLLNATIQKLDNEGHQFQTSSNGNNGFSRPVDLDGSLEKTFTYKPNTLDMANPASSQPWATLARSDGTNWTSNTPLDILTKSAAAKTKADCATAFPQLTTTSTELTGLSNTNKATAVTDRNNELNSCLNQWNDYLPPLIRYFVKKQVDERKNLDLRFDFKVNNELGVYTKGSYSRRKVDDTTMTYQLGQASVNGTLADGVTNAYTDLNGVRTPATGYYYLPNALNATVKGAEANFDPATMVVDATHHLTQFTLNNASVGVDQYRSLTQTNAKYLQLGGKFKRGGFTAEWLFGTASSDFYKGELRGSFGYNYGATTVSLDKTGAWLYTTPTTTDLNKATNFIRITPGTGGSPTVSDLRKFTFQNPRAGESSEKTGKVDLSYALPSAVPFFTRLKGGVSLRDNVSASWTAAGQTVQAAVGTEGQLGYIPAITVPTALVNMNIQGCENTSASLASGGTPCTYGFIPSTTGTLSGNYVMPMDQYRSLLTAVISTPATATKLFNGADGRPAGMIDNWNQIDVQKLAQMLNLPFFNYDCLKQCKGTDGKIYDQPVSRAKERTSAAYLMTEFTVDRFPFTERALPFGWQIDGNIGMRYVRTSLRATGNATFTSIVYAPDSTPAAPKTITTSVTRNTSQDATNHVYLPSFNMAMWVVPDKAVVRYSGARTYARPPVSRLVASGSCTYDQTKLATTAGEDDEDMTCTTFGNPNLKGQQNFNQNLSLEWYPNKDTMLTLSGYKQAGKVGPNQAATLTGVPLFAGSTLTDPATGAPLSNLLFDYRTYINGPVYSRKGVELSSKTAFTFLPWRLRYTGLDANVTRQRSVVGAPYYDPISGASLPPVGEARLSYNWALWYDDGKFSARVAMQTVGASFRSITPSTTSGNDVRDYPLANVTTSSATPPYNPGSALWRDRRSFVDAKLSYRFNKNFEIFVEGRNLTNSTQNDVMPSVSYADGTPSLQNYAYAGRRITIGLNFRNL